MARAASSGVLVAAARWAKSSTSGGGSVVGVFTRYSQSRSWKRGPVIASQLARSSRAGNDVTSTSDVPSTESDWCGCSTSKTVTSDSQ